MEGGSKKRIWKIEYNELGIGGQLCRGQERRFWGLDRGRNKILNYLEERQKAWER